MNPAPAGWGPWRRAWRARRGHTSALLLALGIGYPSAALRAQPVVRPRGAAFWVGAAVLTAGVAFDDAGLSSSSGRNHRTTLNRLANTLQPLGAQRYDIPVLAGAWVAARLVGRRPGGAALRIAAAYVAADLLESALKFAVGRRRPDVADGGPWRFRPFSTRDAWQSFPSAHTTHVFSIAAGIAEEVRSPVVTVAAYGAAALVGWQRIESRAHWPSDVVLSAALAIAVSQTTDRWLRRGRVSGPSGTGGLRMLATPRALGLSLALP